MEAETLRLFAAVALVLPGVFYIGFGNVLVVRPQSTAIAMLVIIALLIGVWGHLTNRLSVFLVLALALPSYQYLVFHILHKAFVLRFQRSPETAVFNFAYGMLPDRLFSVVLLALAVLLPVFGVALIFRA